MRVIAGTYRRRPIQSLHGEHIRPTADRLRESLFNVLCGRNLEALAGTSWFDLFAGTGAVGIEAISRGAGHVTFVESSAEAARLIEKNLSSLGIRNGYELLRLEVFRALPQLAKAGRTADFIFVDPPYRDHATYSKVIALLSEQKLAAEQGRVIVEHARKFDPGETVDRLQRYRKLQQGDSALSFYRMAM